MPYTINISFYEGNTLHESGQTFDHEDKAYIAKLLDDGNIVEAGETSTDQGGGNDTAAPLVDQNDSGPRAVNPSGFPLKENEVAAIESTEPSPTPDVQPAPSAVELPEVPPEHLNQSPPENSSDSDTPQAPPISVQLN